jgi:hypothetical protein
MSPRWLGVRHALRALAGGWLLLALSIAVRPRVHEDPVLLRYAPELVVAALLHVLLLPVLWRNRGMLARRFAQLLREGPTLGLAHTMRLGAGFGFVDGLFEAVSSFGWLALTGDPRQARSPLLLWMAPLFGALWGVALGFLLGWLLRAHRGRGLNLRVPVFCFTTLTLYSIGLSLRPPLRGAAVLWLAAGVAWQLTRWVSRREPGLRRVVRLALPVGAAWVLLAGVGEWSLRHWQDSRAYRGLPAPAAGAPNVLLLILDTVRAPELSL